jgi:hypothetical protein
MTGNQGDRQKTYPNFIVSEGQKGFKMLQSREEICCKECINGNIGEERSKTRYNFLREFFTEISR